MKTLQLKLNKRAYLRSIGWRKFSGRLLWKGSSSFDGSEIMAIMTNYATNSTNQKIGEEFVQIYILAVKDIPRVGFEEKRPSVCGSCSHLGNGCYVQWPQLKALYNCVIDQIPLLDEIGGADQLNEILKDQTVRVGAAGDGVALPFWLVKLIVEASKAHTMYTHAWYMLDLPNLDKFKRYSMASVDSEAEFNAAKALGWRTFRTQTGKKEDIHFLEGEIQCPADSKGLTCAKCRLCDGNKRSNKIKDITIQTHGSNMYRFQIDGFDHPKFDQVWHHLND
tara:strand:- start:50 stop:886 length:837 start_codon:yes stop_codon:yes gene_type:complete